VSKFGFNDPPDTFRDNFTGYTTNSVKALKTKWSVEIVMIVFICLNDCLACILCIVYYRDIN